MKRRRRRTESRDRAPVSTIGDLAVDAFVERAARRAFATFLRGILRGADQEPSRTV